ncbi:MAG: methyltransferase domain-containing protein [bacterium]|nr:methyltransferase domain-containing protein [bacterium]
MRYFFILGSNPTLSLAELAAIFSNGKLSLIQKSVVILESNQTIKSDILKKIGGTIKFGAIYNELFSSAAKDILGSLSFAAPKTTNGKFYFGISHYGKSRLNLKVLGMEFKKMLKQAGISSRWVISKEPTLSSVVVEQNKLTSDRGVEIVIIEFNKKFLLGKTFAVQPFKELSFRDYGRPARDDRSGMLPPKLAQMMINLAVTPPLAKGAGGILQPLILDPFCGSGTVLTEAALMGFQHLTGTDISDRAISGTKKNLDWTIGNWKLEIGNLALFNLDARDLSQKLKPQSVDYIITEPYLGPQRGAHDLNKTINELEKLYSDSLREFNKILKPNGRIVMIWPVFQRAPSVIPAKAGIQKGTIAGTLHPNLSGFTILNPIPANLQKNIFLKLTNRQTIIYGRDGQKVWREIAVLEKHV